MNKTLFYLLPAAIALLIGSAVSAAPLPPSGITATSTSPTTVSVAWSSSTGAVSYQVFRNSTTTPIATTSGLAFVDAGLTPSSTYLYYLAAVDASSTASALSSSTAVTTLADTVAPSIPSGLSITPYSNTQTNLTWASSTDNVSVFGYKVYVNGSTTSKAFVGTPGYADVGLTPSTAYSYQVSSIDAAGNESARSASVSTTTLSDIFAPSVPSGLTAIAISDTRINLSWTASTDNVAVAGYRVYVNGSYKASSFSNGFSDTGLSASTAYSYQVSAIDTSGNESSRSATVTASTLSRPANIGTTTVYMLNVGRGGVKQVNVRSNGIVNIVVLSTPTFDATAINMNTADFGGASQAGARITRMNGDRLRDVVFRFRMRDMEDLTASSTTALFTAKMNDNVTTISKIFPVRVVNADRFWEHFKKPEMERDHDDDDDNDGDDDDDDDGDDRRNGKEDERSNNRKRD